MKDTKHFDEVFRKKFEAFEVSPPESVWDRIKAKLPNGTSGTLFSNPVSIASVAAMALIALIISLIFIKQNNPNFPAFTSPELSTEKITATPEASLPDNTFNEITPGQQATVNGKEQKAIAQTPKRETTFGKKFDPEKNAVIPEKEAAFNAERLNPSGNLILPGRPSGSQLLASEQRKTLNPDFGLDKKKKFRMLPEWYFGIHLTPEAIFYPKDNIQNQLGYILDLSASLHYSDYFIETGIGLNFSKDEGSYDIDYEQFLGTYDDVYLVTFDSTENGIEPVYHTNPVDVYDSVKQVYKPTKNRYTYLQIPLLFGVKKQFNRFTYFVKGGPTFAILIHKNVSTPELGYKDKVMRLDEAQPSRVNTNWQILLSAGMSYQLNRNISFSIEPVFRYYVRSAFERTYVQSKHQYAIGLRAGLLFNF